MVAEMERPLFKISGSAPVQYLFFNFFHRISQSSDALILESQQSPVLGKNRFIGKITYNYVSYAFLKMHLQLVLFQFSDFYYSHLFCVWYLFLRVS